MRWVSWFSFCSVTGYVLTSGEGNLGEVNFQTTEYMEDMDGGGNLTTKYSKYAKRENG